MSTYAKPLPVIDDLNRPYWHAAKQHRLELPKCDACGHVRAQFDRWCPQCGSDRFTWTPMSGRGVVWTHCTFHHAYFKSFESDLPYGVAIVELDEGPRLVTNIVGIDRTQVRIGLRVEVFFDDVTDDIALVKFRPTDRQSGGVA